MPTKINDIISTAMDAKGYLADYAQKADLFLDKFFERKRGEASQIDGLATECLMSLEVYMEGGKKARGALVVLGYRLAGGKDLKKIMPASLGVEFMHSGLLIHDDFVDRDEIRRGKPTIHESYAQRRGDDHYGASMATIIGDLAIFLANSLILESGFKHEYTGLALAEFNKFLINTGYGELMDIDFDYNARLSWDDVLKVRIYKTAHYTFVMPLVVGAILGGGDRKLIRSLVKYGEPIGLAFQLQDDVLGAFGDPAVTGKSDESDIREGKKTLLYYIAKSMARREDKAFLKKWYGERKVSGSQIKKIRKIIQTSGALEYSVKKAEEYVKVGKKVIPSITGDNELQSTLGSLADYMITRQK